MSGGGRTHAHAHAHAYAYARACAMVDRTLVVRKRHTCLLLRLDGDTFAHVLDHLLRLSMHEPGAALRGAIRVGVDAVGALSATCRAAYKMVHSAPCQVHAVECGARRNCIVLARCGDYVTQYAAEKQSCTHVWMLREAVRGIVLHCAGACCMRVRRALRKAFATSSRARGGGMRPLANTARSLAVASNAPVAFVFAHYRKLSRRTQWRDHTVSGDAEAQPRRHGDVIRRIEVSGPVPHETQAAPAPDETTHELQLQGEGRRVPEYTSASPCGRWFAYVASALDDIEHLAGHGQHEEQEWDENARRVMVWDTQSGAHHALAPMQGAGWVNPNGDLISARPMLYPQNLGWCTLPDAHTTLLVAYSTSCVTASGLDSGDAVSASDHYMLAQHDVHTDGTLVQLDGPFWGRLCALKLDTRGDRAVAVVRNHTWYVRRLLRDAVVHRLSGTTPSKHSESRLVSKVWMRSIAPDGSSVETPETFGMAGPRAAGISPSGDVIACVQKTHESVLVETFQLKSGTSYASVRVKDITNWVTRVPVSMPPYASMASGGMNASDRLVKLPYDVGFSPCGRFVVVTDRRLLFGGSLPNHAVVFLDLGTLHRSKGMRLCPIAAVDESAPRQLEWTRQGLWMLVRHGACLLQGPVAA